MRRYRVLAALLLITTGLPLANSPAAALPPALAQAALQWRATGLNWQQEDGASEPCFDASQPNVVFVNEKDIGTVAYNLATAARTFINVRFFSICGPRGLLFGWSADDHAWRFGSDTPTQLIDRLPTNVAQDGSLTVYAYKFNTPGLWVSLDGGLSWQQRSTPQAIHSLTVYGPDARVLSFEGGPGGSIFASTDAGQTWDQRGSTGVQPDPSGFSYTQIYLCFLSGATASPSMLIKGLITSFRSHVEVVSIYLSKDGGRTFQQVGDEQRSQEIYPTHLLQTADGSILIYRPDFETNTRITNGGTSQQPLSYPPNFPAAQDRGSLTGLIGVPNAPANVFLFAQGSLYYSSDNAHTWQQTTNDASIVFDLLVRNFRMNMSPYLPLIVLGQSGAQVLELPDAGRQMTAAASPNDAPGSRYFPATGHNVPERFLDYWNRHGGLAQFGQPRTDAFPEVSPTDGRVYVTQYFERARFEYHPDFAGTDNEVELGLLGSEATARRAAGEPPFQSVPDPQQPGVTYFPQTGHTLRGPFAAYWAQHGGLALYGYPLSEEYTEDGYTVQYFQRNRFEYHPAWAGTPYEIELGLLGNDLLVQKGWQ